MTEVMKVRVRKYGGRMLLFMGLKLLVVVAIAMVHRSMFSQRALAEFDKDQAELLQAGFTAVPVQAVDEGVDFALWSEKRIREYRASLIIKKDAPMGVLSIVRLSIRAPIFEGTNDLILNRGLGWIPSTARPGSTGNGNIGLAGHRDGFFRALKDIAVGDEVQLATLGHMGTYTVDSTEIVYPDNVGVLRPRSTPSLTLVTCYPFYFVGDAPQRFIVHAALKGQSEVGKLQGGSPTERTAQSDTKEKK